MGKQANPERVREIIRLYCENNTLEFIASAVGVSWQAVQQTLHKEGINTKRRRPIKPPNFKPKRSTAKERFWNLVDTSNGENSCWLWKGKPAAGNFGYGRFCFRGKAYYAHHLSWFFTYRKFATNWHLHDCGNAACCNPKHIYDGTPKQNSEDRIRHGTNKWHTVGRKGEKHGRARLTEKQVKEIKILLASKSKTHVELGKIYNVSDKTISSISGNHTWRHVEI
jgi:hypothetical protein